MKPDTPNRYGTVTRFLHWTMALCMVWMVFSALIPDALTDKSAQAFFRNGHKQVGSLLFVLIIVRLGWAVANARRRPASLSLAAKLGHWALYALMLAIPSIALLRQYGSGRAPLSLPRAGPSGRCQPAQPTMRGSTSSAPPWRRCHQTMATWPATSATSTPASSPCSRPPS